MSTLTISTTSINNAAIATSGEAAQAVVQNDTATAAMPSISLTALGVPATVRVEGSDAADPKLSLTAMEQARISWETTELAASNKRLYSILHDAYSFYLEMKRDNNKGTRKDRVNELESFIKEHGYTFMPSSHDMTRVVKCVFGVDRRRVSAYSIALREALRQEIAAADLVAFIEENGGVEQIRLGGSKPLSAKVRAEKIKQEVLSAELGTIKFDARFVSADADWADKQVVIVATYLPTGEFQANAVIKHDSAVNAALAAIYSQQQAKRREAEKADREAEKEAQAQAAAELKAGSKEQADDAKYSQQQLDAIAAARREHEANLAKIRAQYECVAA